MKTWIKVVLALAIGLMLGGAGGFFYMGRAAKSIMGLYYGAAVMEMAVNAREIRLGQTDRMLQRLDAALPNVATQYHQLFQSDPSYTGTMWTVQRYYEENPDVRLPPDLKAILAALPSRPMTSCDIRRAAATASAPAREDRPSTATE